MFKAGDMVVYGGTDVCRVLGVLIPEFAKKRGTEYYELEPVYESGTIYAPRRQIGRASCRERV